MNAVIEEARENVAEFRAPGPGDRLRAARLSAGLELSSVANRLHLDIEMVDLLERDQYELLPERVFVQGYARNYARLVGLSPESVLKQLDEHCPGCAVRKFDNVGKSVGAEVRSGSPLVRLVTFGIIFGMAALFFVWWKGYLTWLETEQAQPTEIVAPAVAPVAEADGALPLPPRAPFAVVKNTSQPSGGALEAVPVATSDLSSTLVQARPTHSNEIALRTTPMPLTVAPAAMVSPRPSPAEGREDATVTLPQVTTAPSVGLGDQQVVLEFFEPCWVDVRDSTRDFKLFGEMAKGARKILGGEPPYNVVIGKSSAVRVTVDGVFYDIRRHARGNVARFTLDPSSMN